MKEGHVIKSVEAGAEDMAAINRYTRRAYQPEEVYTFSLVLCDNEVDRDYERFNKGSLEKLRELFLGKTCILDHECKSANQTARIYHTQLESCQEKTTQAGEGLIRLTAKAYLPRTQGNQETIALIDSGILKEVSVSCSVKRRVCGLCGKEDCQHVPGKTYQGKIAHRVLLEPADAYECSFVAVPAQRGAGVVKRFAEGDEKQEGQLVLTKAQAQELREKARWGELYRRALEKDILKYSGIVQPEMPREVMESAVKAMGMEDLETMGRAYEKMAGKLLPLRPQLTPERREEQPEENGGFRI